MPTVPSQNSNQFRQTQVRGQRDLGIVAGAGCISCQLSANESGTLYAGYRVKLDAAITSPMPYPQVKAALDNEDAIGVIAYTVQKSTFVTGDKVEVLCNFGPIVVEVAAATIAPGAKVEMSSGFVQTKAAGSTFGIALDPGVLNGFCRIAILSPLQA